MMADEKERVAGTGEKNGLRVSGAGGRRKEKQT
jgi:hypothetical protein